MIRSLRLARASGKLCRHAQNGAVGQPSSFRTLVTGARPPPPQHCRPISHGYSMTCRVDQSLASLQAFSTTTASTSSDSDKSGDDDSNKKEKKKSAADEPNIFLDNLGKIFLTAIAAVIAALVRSSRGTTNKTNLRDYIENHALLDPLEIDDLRVANSELTPEVFEAIMEDVYSTFPSGRASYVDFVSVVIQTMRRLKGEAFTIQLGHLLDRVAIAVVEKESRGTQADRRAGGDATEYADPTKAELSLPLLFAILSLALKSNVAERVRLLFKAMERNGSSGEAGKVTQADVVDMVGYLQQTCQLVPDAQIIQSDVKYPAQQYLKGTPQELVICANKIMAEEGNSEIVSWDEKYNVADFHRVLRTKQVCAWGECYAKTKNLS